MRRPGLEIRRKVVAEVLSPEYRSGCLPLIDVRDDGLAAARGATITLWPCDQRDTIGRTTKRSAYNQPKSIPQYNAPAKQPLGIAFNGDAGRVNNIDITSRF